MSEFFHDINQFKDVIRTVKDRTYYVGKDELGNPIFDKSRSLPTIKFRGTTKIHGSSGSVVFDCSTDEITALSRSRVLSIESDNYGFAFFVESRKEFFGHLFNSLLENFKVRPDKIVLHGEWAGKGIQKSVAVSELEKSFYIFDIKLIKNDSEYYITQNELEDFLYSELEESEIAKYLKIYSIFQFETWTIDIDFNNPELSVNTMVQWVSEVENECPVGKEFGVIGVGEGICFKADVGDWQLVFKCKGEKHQESKVKTLLPVDTEKLNSVSEFVEYAVTEHRLEKMIDKLKETELTIETKNLGQFLKFITSDVFKEETDTLKEAGLEPKDVTKQISNKARTWFLNNNERYLEV